MTTTRVSPMGVPAALRDYVGRLMELPTSIFTVKATPEDWDGLRRYVADSTGISHRSEILSLIDSDLEPDPKEARIKSLYPEDYAYMLRNWYPALRHSDYRVDYTVRSFSVEEAKALLRTKPQQLSLNELYLVAQTYEPGSPEFDEVFQIAVRMFPDSPEANLNSANIALREDRLSEAEAYLRKAGQFSRRPPCPRRSRRQAQRLPASRNALPSGRIRRTTAGCRGALHPSSALSVARGGGQAKDDASFALPPFLPTISIGIQAPKAKGYALPQKNWPADPKIANKLNQHLSI